MRGFLVDRRRLEVVLNAAIVAVVDDNPCILRVPGAPPELADALPWGPFDPLAHRTMEIGLRRWVEEQTGLNLGYVEQLYTFGDRGRHRSAEDEAPHVVSVGYLALTRVQGEQASAIRLAGASFRSWYAFLPWEDWRAGRPDVLDRLVIPALDSWSHRADRAAGEIRGLLPSARTRLAFGLDGAIWDEERALERYEVMYSAGLVHESVRDGRYEKPTAEGVGGSPMEHDHRRILATAISRLRAKLKYRPVIFELLPEEFTLTELQQTVESIFGREVHKQNFRRLVEKAQLVEPTGASAETGGRPAALFHFRREVLEERPGGIRMGRR